MRDLTLSIILRFIADQFTNGLNAARRQLLELSGSAITSDTAMGRFHQRINIAARSVLDFGGAIRGLIAGFSLLAIAYGIKGVIELADNLRLIEGRIKSASDGAVDFARNYAGLVGISFNTGTALSENANMFSRINAGMRDMGGASRDTLRQVDLVAKGLRLSNAGTGETASVIRQWSQAIASGLLRGDEFNSMMENAPRLAKAMADGLGVNIGVLRAMAEAGELTSAKAVQALVSQGKAIDQEFKKLPVSIGAAFEKIKTAFGQYVAEADRGAGATAGLAGGMESIANNMKPLMETAVTLAKLLGIVLAGAAISGIGSYLAALWAINQAQRALATMTHLHTEALREDLQRTVQLTGARVQQIEVDIAATRATLAGTLAMGERMAVTNTLNLQTQSLTAATLAQTEATAALSASTVSFGARVMSALKPMNLLNLAMAFMAGYAVGEWLNSFTVVKKGAIIAIDAIVSALADLEYHLKKTGLLWELKFTFSDEGINQLNQKLADLDAEFVAGARIREETKQGLLDDADAAGKVKTATEELIDTFKNAKTPADTFKEKARALTEEFNKQKKATDDSTLSLETYTKALLFLHNAMQTDIAKNQTPFQKEQADLQDKVDKATLSPEDYQRKQYLKTNSAEETDTLMALWAQTKDGQKEVAQTTKKLTKETLDAQLTAIKTQQDALKAAGDNELQQTKNTYAAKELDLKQQQADQLITEQQLAEKLLDLKKAQADEELNIKRDQILRESELKRAAITAQIQAAQQDAPVSSMTPLFKQAEQKYNLPPNLVQAVAQVESAGGKNAGASSAGALGVMQLMPTTAKSLGVTDRTDPAQSIEGGAKLLRELLDTFNGDVRLALMAYNSNPAKVKSVGGDLSKMKPETQAYLPKVLGEMQNPTLTTGHGTAEDKQALTVKIAALNAQLTANEADTVAQLKSLGLDEQNTEIAQSDAELALKKATLAQKKQLDAENNSAEHEAALAVVDAKEVASQQELDLGNITQEQHLANLRTFAAQRLAIEQKFLDDKRKLLAGDALELAKNLNAKTAATKQGEAAITAIEDKAALARKAAFKEAFAPFETAMDGMVQGVLTGQQTIGNAVKNAAASIVTSYAASFIKTRIMNNAQWLWEVAGFAGKEAKKKAIQNGSEIWQGLLWVKRKALLTGEWLFETLGFSAKEATKTAVKITSETAQAGIVAGSETVKAGAVAAGEAVQTGAVAAGESARSGITLMGTLKAIGAKAAQAAAGAYSWVMTEVPWPLNIILAPVAAVAAFVGTMAFGGGIGSAKGGELEVEKDNAPFILHKKESVLPAGVADNFRKVVDMVKHVTAPEKDMLPANTHEIIRAMIETGQLKGGWSVPQELLKMPAQAMHTATALVNNAQQHQQTTNSNTSKVTEVTHHHQPIHFAPVYNNDYIDAAGGKKFVKEHSREILKQLQSLNRRFVS